MNPNYLPVRDDWLKTNLEPALEPDLPIVDTHHHFYDRPGWQYLHEDYLADSATGHNIRATVYMQGLTRYRPDGPTRLQPVGETEFVVATATNTGIGASQTPEVAKGIVAYADLRLGHAVDEVLAAHAQAAKGRLRGIRHLCTWDADSSLTNPLSAAPAKLLQDSAYRKGLARLAAAGLVYDAWLFWPQLPELVEVADAFPDLPIVLNHCGGIVRIGAYANQPDAVRNGWQTFMRELALRPNVFVKLGGLGMRINGFDFEKAAIAPSSDELMTAWKPWMLFCIDAFGPRRCMFESNFPVDKGSYSFVNGWNAFKKLSIAFTPNERQRLFHDTASQVYKL